MSNRSALRSVMPEMRSGCVPLLIGVFVVLFVGIFAVSLFGSMFETGTKTVVVQDKGRVCDSNRDCKYLVYTDDTTYELTDSILTGRFNTSDVYGGVKRCHKYEIKYRGVRVGFLSMYPNIEKMQDLGRVENCDPY